MGWDHLWCHHGTHLRGSASAGVFEQLRAEALAAFDRIIGLDLTEAALDGSLHKAPYDGEGTGPSPLTGANKAGSGPSPCRARRSACSFTGSAKDRPHTTRPSVILGAALGR